MADKSNAMQEGHALWQRVFGEVSADYPDVTTRHLYIDALAMMLVQDPRQFDVIVQQPIQRHHHGYWRRPAG